MATNEELLEQLKNGVDVKKELVEKNLGLVYTIVGSFIRSMPRLAYLHDDMLSQGFLILTTVIDAIHTRDIRTTVGRYVADSINNKLRTWIREETSLVPPQTQIDYDNDDAELGAPTVKTAGLIIQLKETPEPTELLDAIYAACETDEDRVIVDLRRKGYKDRYIAKVLNISKTQVNDRRAAIEERYDSANLS